MTALAKLPESLRNKIEDNGLSILELFSELDDDAS